MYSSSVSRSSAAAPAAAPAPAPADEDRVRVSLKVQIFLYGIEVLELLLCCKRISVLGIAAKCGFGQSVGRGRRG